MLNEAAPPDDSNPPNSAPEGHRSEGDRRTGAAKMDAEGMLTAARNRCTRFLNGHGLRSTRDLLATIPPDTEMDRYGHGGVVRQLETRIAAVLGKDAALFLPSGTMAQQATLRVHADRRGRHGVAFHPACHLDWYEGRGYQRLHGLYGLPVGGIREPLSIHGLHTIYEAPAALLLELPQRDLGGVLPAWSELQAMTDWARDRGAAVHMDGARLWESTPFYDRTPAEIAALFDTVYVSFYKGLGGIAGCCVAGPRDIIGEVSEWRIRHGGRLFGLWPYAASALTALEQRLPLMPRYYRHARAIADALADIPDVTVLPHPPQTPMMHVQLAVTAEELAARALQIAEQDGIWTYAQAFSRDGPAQQRIEVTVGDATLAFTPKEVQGLFSRLAHG